MEEYTRFGTGVNHADVLTRRLEAYHEVAIPSHEPVEAPPGASSRHDVERGLTLVELPPLDAEPRALFHERLLSAHTEHAAFAAGRAAGFASWAQTPLTCDVVADREGVRVTMAAATDPDAFRKTYVFSPEGLIAVEFLWRPPDAPDAWFATEISHQGPLGLHATPAADIWEYPIETVAKSERGLERTVQGMATVLRWPAALGTAAVTLDPVRRP